MKFQVISRKLLLVVFLVCFFSVSGFVSNLHNVAMADNIVTGQPEKMNFDSGNTNPLKSKDGVQSYTDETFGISFDYPQSWQAGDMYFEEGIRQIIIQNDALGEIVIENVPNPDALSPQQWYQSHQDDYRTDLIKEIGNTMIRGNPAYIVAQPETSETIPMIVVFISHGESMLVITDFEMASRDFALELEILLTSIQFADQHTQRSSISPTFFEFPTDENENVISHETLTSEEIKARRCPGAPAFIPTEGTLNVPWRCFNDDKYCKPYKERPADQCKDDNKYKCYPHSGIDIFGGQAAGVTPVYATRDGSVVGIIGKSAVRIKFDNKVGDVQYAYYTHMAHAVNKTTVKKFIDVKMGEKVIGGVTQIGRQGDYGTDAGVHLHISYSETYTDYWFKHPTSDPTPLLRAKNLVYYDGWHFPGEPITCIDSPEPTSYGAVTGYVLDGNNSIIADATVTVKSGDFIRETTTDEYGIYSFEFVPQGNAQFTAELNGIVVGAVDAMVYSNACNQVDIKSNASNGQDADGQSEVNAHASQLPLGTSETCRPSGPPPPPSSPSPTPPSPSPTPPPPSPTPNQCPNDNRPGVYLYADKDYRGACFYTDHNIDDLGQTAVGDNNVSSARVVGHYTVKLYEHRNQQGRSVEFSHDERDLDSKSIGGKYSSLRISPEKDADLVSRISTTTSHGYKWQRCGKGDKVYTDRDYVFTKFSKSSYDGRWCIIFPNDDKRNSDQKYVTFELNHPATVYVYFDRRMKNPPAWVGSLFNKNSKKVYTSDHDMDYFQVYSCRSDSGVITLGGPHFNGGDGAKSMYVVAFGKEDHGEQLCNTIAPPPEPTATPTPRPTVTPTPTPTPTPRPSAPLEVIRGLEFQVNNPMAGEMVNVRFTVKNVSGHTLTLRRLGVAGRGPNCQDWNCPRVVDWPWEEHLTLAPNETHTFVASRTLPDAGNGYFTQMLYSLSENDWHFIGDVRHFSVQQGLSVIEPLRLDPPNPLMGQIVTASYTIQNSGNRPLTLSHLGVVSKGPNCQDWNCDRWADFPMVDNITLQPGERYRYEKRRTFNRPGNGYFADPAFGDGNGWWFFAPGGQRVNFSVSPVFEVIEDMHLSTSNPAAGESVTARFIVKNVSGRTLQLRRLGVAAKGPDCNDWNCTRVVDWPWVENFTLQPGETFTYEQQRAFPESGNGYFGKIMFSFSDNDWNLLGSKRQFTVSPGLRVIEPLQLIPSNPQAGEQVVARYGVQNESDHPITLRYLGVVVRGPGCQNWDCRPLLDYPAEESITLQPGQIYRFEERRSFPEVGNGYFAEPAFGDFAGWWYPTPQGQRIHFNVSEPTSNPPAQSCLFIQAEDGANYGMALRTSSNTSGGRYLQTIHPWSNDKLIIPFDVSEAQDYYLWVRAKGTDWNHNSFWVSLDNGREYHFEILPRNDGSWGWDWRSAPPPDEYEQPISIQAGSHTLQFRSREPSSAIDAIVLTANPDFVPSGLNPCPAEPPNSDNSLQNGDFEAGPDSGWFESSARGRDIIVRQENVTAAVTAHSGDWLAWMGGQNNEVSLLQQKVTVPMDAPILSIWYWMTSRDYCGYDFAGIRVNGTEVMRYDLCKDNKTRGWVHESINLSAYRGQSVTLELRVETDGSLRSHWFVDDVGFVTKIDNTAMEPDNKMSPYHELDEEILQQLDNIAERAQLQPGQPIDRIWQPNAASKPQK